MLDIIFNQINFLKYQNTNTQTTLINQDINYFQFTTKIVTISHVDFEPLGIEDNQNQQEQSVTLYEPNEVSQEEDFLELQENDFIKYIQNFIHSTQYQRFLNSESLNFTQQNTYNNTTYNLNFENSDVEQRLETLIQQLQIFENLISDKFNVQESNLSQIKYFVIELNKKLKESTASTLKIMDKQTQFNLRYLFFHIQSVNNDLKTLLNKELNDIAQVKQEFSNLYYRISNIEKLQNIDYDSAFKSYLQTLVDSLDVIDLDNLDIFKTSIKDKDISSSLLYFLNRMYHTLQVFFQRDKRVQAKLNSLDNFKSSLLDIEAKMQKFNEWHSTQANSMSFIKKQQYDQLEQQVFDLKNQISNMQSQSSTCDKCTQLQIKVDTQQQQINELFQKFNSLKVQQSDSQQQSGSNKSISLVQQQQQSKVQSSSQPLIKSNSSTISSKDKKNVSLLQKSIIESSIKSKNQSLPKGNVSIQNVMQSQSSYQQRTRINQTFQSPKQTSQLNQQNLQQFSHRQNFSLNQSQSSYSLSQKASSAPFGNKTFTSTQPASSFKLNKYLQSTQAKSTPPNYPINHGDVDPTLDVTTLLDLPIEDPTRENKFHKFDFKEKFSGDKNYTQIWIDRFQLSCVKYNLTHSQCLFQAQALMQSIAIQWFLTEKNSFAFRDFYDFKNRFLQEFSVSQDDARRELFITIRSKQESDEQYLKRLRDIAVPAALPDKDVKYVFVTQLENSRIDPIFKQLILKDDNFRSDQILKYLQEYNKQAEFNSLIKKGTSSSPQGSNTQNSNQNQQNSSQNQGKQVIKSNSFGKNEQQQNFQNQNQQNYKGKYKKLAQRYINNKFKNKYQNKNQQKQVSNVNIDTPIANLDTVIEENEISDDDLESLFNAIFDNESVNNEEQSQPQNNQESQNNENNIDASCIDFDDVNQVEFEQLEPEYEVPDQVEINQVFPNPMTEQQLLELELNAIQTQVNNLQNTLNHKKQYYENKFKNKYNSSNKQKDPQSSSQGENYLSRFNPNNVYFIPNKNILIRSPEYYINFLKLSIQLLKEPSNMLANKNTLQSSQNFLDSLDETFSKLMQQQERDYNVSVVTLSDMVQHQLRIRPSIIGPRPPVPQLNLQLINSFQINQPLKYIPLENQLVAKDSAPLQFAKVKLFDKDVFGMIDTGAVVSIISQPFIEYANLHKFVQSCNVLVSLAVNKKQNDQQEQQYQTITSYLPNQQLILNNTLSIKINLYVTPQSKWSLLLGRNFLETIKFKYANNCLYYYVPTLKSYQKQLLFSPK